MEKSTNDFFDSKNTVHSLDEEDYERLQDYLAPIRAQARITYQSIYVIDYFSQQFEYVSENPLFLCGLSPQTVQNMGYAFYLEKVIPTDYDLLIKINKVGFDFFQSTPIADRLKYYISYDFHIQENEDKPPVLINHRLTPIIINKHGKVWKALCIVSLSVKQSAGNILVGKEGTNSFFRYDLDKDLWTEEEKIILSEREKDIIKLSARGLNINDIGSILFLSSDAVKYHRRKLFQKLNANTINEAIAFATYQSLI